MWLRRARLIRALCLATVGATALLLAPSWPLGVPSAHAAEHYSGRGVVRAIAEDRSSVTIAHEAIPGFMPAMTMSFEARSADQLAGLHAGDRVTFSFTVTGDARRLIDSIRRVATSQRPGRGGGGRADGAAGSG